MFPRNLFVNRNLRERTSFAQDAWYLYIYMRNIICVRDGKKTAVSRKGRCGMNLSWRSKWRERGGVESRERSFFFLHSPEVCRCREEKEKDDGEIKVLDTGGNFLGTEWKRKRGRYIYIYRISMNEREDAAFMIINSIIDLDGNFYRHFPWNFFIIFASFKNAQIRKERRSLSVFPDRRASACRKV